MKQLTREKLLVKLRERATKLGFTEFGIMDAGAVKNNYSHLQNSIKNGWHAQMNWLSDRPKRRAFPKILWPEVKSIIVVGLNYAPNIDIFKLLKKKNRAFISSYALNRDYHDIIKGRLKELASILSSAKGIEEQKEAKVKIFVDTAPVMEKALAQKASIGWMGKHSVIVSRKSGSYLFLGVIYTNIDLPKSKEQQERCGSCEKCLTICPTNAFIRPYVLDARKCLAYYNNEHKGHIPLEFRILMGNRIFGCDDCIAICPWNKFAKSTSEIKLQAREELIAPEIAQFLSFDDKKFRAFFTRSPIKRLGIKRFLRNVLICAGNSEDKTLLAQIKFHLTDDSPLVRAMAVWALYRLEERKEFLAMRQFYLKNEKDEQVVNEWNISG